MDRFSSGPMRDAMPDGFDLCEVDAAKPTLILQCDVFAETMPAAIPIVGEVDAVFRRALQRDGHPAAVVRACWGEAPGDPRDYSAVLVTGSGAMVNDPDPWIAGAAAWLRRACSAGVPILGVCFGHQLLAHALGGTVAPMPSGPEYGTFELRRTAAGARDPLFAALPDQFPAQAAHFQAVLAPPDGSVVLAEGASGIQALRFGPRAWGVQFHPEFTTDAMRMIIEAIAGAFAAAGVDVAARIAGLSPAPEAADIVARFGRLAAASEAGPPGRR